MRLYLSSFRMGDHPEHLLALAGQDSRRAVVIANALDDAPPDVRRAGAERELAALTGLGLEAAELDLRGYFGPRQLLRRDLAGIGLAWLRGGNVFMGPRARRRSSRGHAGLRRPGRHGTAWRCSPRRSSRITGHPGIPRRRRSSGWWPGTAPTASRTAPCATGRPCSSTARRR